MKIHGHSPNFYALDAAERIQQALYATVGPILGSKAISGVTGSDADAYYQLQWLPRKTVTSNILKDSVVTTPPSDTNVTSLRPKGWESASILAADRSELNDMLGIHKKYPSHQDAVAYRTEGAWRVGIRPGQEDLFSISIPRLGRFGAIAVREGVVGGEFAMGVYDIDNRHFTAASSTFLHASNIDVHTIGRCDSSEDKLVASPLLHLV